jgi:hypothetical protein
MSGLTNSGPRSPGHGAALAVAFGHDGPAFWADEMSEASRLPALGRIAGPGRLTALGRSNCSADSRSNCARIAAWLSAARWGLLASSAR